MRKEDKISQEKIQTLRETLHAHPELSNHEVVTRKIIREFLEQHTDTKVHDRGEWLFAVHEEEGATETLVFRADHDAIVNGQGEPFHGCGHDGHTAMLAGTAMALTGKTLGKNILYLFQPAEENGTGAKLCTPLFSEFAVDAVYGLHNMPGLAKNAFFSRSGTVQYASLGLTLQFRGKQAHASEPENGISPAFAIAQLMLLLAPFHERHPAPLVIDDKPFSGPVFATIVHAEVGSENFGIAPGTGSLSCTLRAENDADLARLHDWLIQQAQDLAGSMQVDVQTSDVFPASANDPQLYEKTERFLKEHGIRIRLLEEPFRASEDFGVYKDYAPTFFVFLGAGEDHAPVHTDGYEFPDDLLETGIGLFTTLAKQ